MIIDRVRVKYAILFTLFFWGFLVGFFGGWDFLFIVIYLLINLIILKYNILSTERQYKHRTDWVKRLTIHMTDKELPSRRFKKKSVSERQAI